MFFLNLIFFYNRRGIVHIENNSTQPKSHKELKRLGSSSNPAIDCRVQCVLNSSLWRQTAGINTCGASGPFLNYFEPQFPHP